jgi:acetoacetate decarboxylase
MPGIPSVAPLYPDPPFEYRDARMIVAFVEGGAPTSVLPPHLEPTPDPIRFVVFADYPDTTIGPYREVIVLVSAAHQGQAGLFCPLIYVTSDAALCAGREIWGFPKKLAEITVTVRGDEVRARLARGGHDLLVLDGETPERVASSAADLAALPIFNHKLIPGSAAKEPDVDVMTSVRLESSAREVWSGQGRLRAAGETAEVLGEPSAVQLLRTIGDAVLPAGETLGYETLD